jgi:hypothetical protein
MSLLDQIKSYYQRMIDSLSRPLTAVVTHRGQEQFNVLLIGYKGSAPHQQRYMDELLWEFIEFVCCYIDDIFVFSDTFEDHVNHLDLLFTKMKEANLALNPKKCSIAFKQLQLLGHMVDKYGVYTMEEKTAAIREMVFPTTLARLEYFLRLTGFYRQFVPYYALRSAPLCKLTTELTKGIRKPDQKRAVKADSVILPPPDVDQLLSFQQLKDTLSSR